MKNHFRKLISKLTSDPRLLSERSVLNPPGPWLGTKSFHVGSICRTTYRFLENLNLKLISNVKICGSGDLSPLRAGIAGGGNLAPTPHTLVSIPNFKNRNSKIYFSKFKFWMSTFSWFCVFKSGIHGFVGKGEANNHCWKEVISKAFAQQFSKSARPPLRYINHYCVDTYW